MSSSINLSDDDVFSTTETTGFSFHSTCKINDLMKAVRTDMYGIVSHPNSHPSPRFKWFDTGFECQILRTEGGGWQSGRLRFRLEFIPDDPVSPLDEFRQTNIE